MRPYRRWPSWLAAIKSDRVFIYLKDGRIRKARASRRTVYESNAKYAERTSSVQTMQRDARYILNIYDAASPETATINYPSQRRIVIKTAVFNFSATLLRFATRLRVQLSRKVPLSGE